MVCFSEGTPFSWWVGGPAPGQVQDFWGGALPGSRQCACGLHNACLDSHHFCNCDADNEQWYLFPIHLFCPYVLSMCQTVFQINVKVIRKLHRYYLLICMSNQRAVLSFLNVSTAVIKRSHLFYGEQKQACFIEKTSSSRTFALWSPSNTSRICCCS